MPSFSVDIFNLVQLSQTDPDFARFMEESRGVDNPIDTPVDPAAMTMDDDNLGLDTDCPCDTCPVKVPAVDLASPTLEDRETYYLNQCTRSADPGSRALYGMDVLLHETKLGRSW